ncbi:hypothetical protein LCGC14_2596880, partial [marine sediment metagenome]
MVLPVLGMTRPGAPFPRPLNYKSELLYHLRAADLLLGHKPGENVLTALTGEVPTFTRASAGGLTRDALGYLTLWGKSVPRIEMYDLDGDGYYETPGVMLEGQRENVCLRSEAINHGDWTNVNSPIVTNDDAEAPDRTISADKIEDDSAADSEGRRQDIGIANDSTTWCASVFVKKAPAGAPVLKLLALLTGGSVPSAALYVDPINGANIASGSVRDSGVVEYSTYYRIWLTVDNDSSGNNNMALFLMPAVRASGDVGAASDVVTTVGSNHFWGVQVENAAFPSTYIYTGGAAVTRVADALTYTLAWLGQ